MNKRTVIHAHHSPRPISGEMKRIKNIDNDVAGILGDSVIEVEFYSLRFFRYVRTEGRFKLSGKVEKKHYIPNMERLGFLNDIWCLLVVFFLMAKYRPAIYLEEWKLPRGIKKIKSLLRCKTKIGLDLHGAAPEEYEYSYGKINRNLERQEKRSVSQSDFIICQSDEMKRHLIKKHNLSENVIAVYRCGVDTELFNFSTYSRAKVRKQLVLDEDEILFVYSGGMHQWQRVADSLSFFQLFHNQFPKSRLMVLTKDTEGLGRIIEESNLSGIKDNLIVRSLSYSEVPAYLCAADASFLLRDDVVMNQVASPTKLAEYMACGLPVLSTKVADKWIDEAGKDFVMDIENRNFEDIAQSIRETSKQAVSEYAVKNLSLSVDRHCVMEFFAKS